MIKRKGFIRRSSLKAMPKLVKKMEKAFNAFIRDRDMILQKGVCISCDNAGTQAGHYFPVQSNPHPSIRFSEINVNLQCSDCNKWKHGNQDGYRKGLIKKYGPNVMTKLAMIRAARKNPWTRFEYETMIVHYTNERQKLSDGNEFKTGCGI